jgi:hypothetical protein
MNLYMYHSKTGMFQGDDRKKTDDLALKEAIAALDAESI